MKMKSGPVAGVWVLSKQRGAETARETKKKKKKKKTKPTLLN